MEWPFGSGFKEDSLPMNKAPKKGGRPGIVNKHSTRFQRFHRIRKTWDGAGYIQALKRRRSDKRKWAVFYRK